MWLLLFEDELLTKITTTPLYIDVVCIQIVVHWGTNYTIPPTAPTTAASAPDDPLLLASVTVN